MVKFLKKYFTVICLFAGLLANAQKGEFAFERLFAQHGDMFDSIIQRKQDYRLQLLYTCIDRDEHNAPHFKTYTFDADKYYYYCASMVKLPACAMALERLNDLSMYKVSMFDSLGIDTIMCPEMSLRGMMLGTPYSCMAQYIKEMLMLSNNRAFNPVYDFLGQYYFQERLHELGLHSAVISNRFAYCDSDQNRMCNPVSLYDRKTQAPKYRQPCIINERKQFYEGPFTPQVGNGYLSDRGNALINQPKDFRNANYISLSDLHHFLIRLMFPESQQPAERLRLTAADYQYLHKCMGLFPRESAYPVLDSTKYPDHYMKYFMGLDTIVHTMPSHLRIFNKVGQAYGFMTDCSYVSDTLDKVEFFLSCSMYLNADGILNDGLYEYDQTGYPFFHNLYNVIYAEEKERPKKYLPKLQWPDFSDTLIVKPVPSWLRVDSMGSMDSAENVLCSLADSMWKVPQNSEGAYGRMSKNFRENLEVVLRMKNSMGYTFAKLKEKKVSIIQSEDSVMMFLSWKGPMGNFVILMRRYIDKLPEINEQYISYYRIEMINIKAKKIYLLWGELDSATAFVIASSFQKDGSDRAEKLFKPEIGKTYTELILAKSSQNKEPIKYDRKRGILIYISKDMKDKWSKNKTVKLKFDGSVFK